MIAVKVAGLVVAMFPNLKKAVCYNPRTSWENVVLLIKIRQVNGGTGSVVYLYTVALYHITQVDMPRPLALSPPIGKKQRQRMGEFRRHI